MGDIGAVLSRLGSTLKQQAFVVTDLDAAKQSMRRSFGCGNFFQFELNTPWDLRGRTVACDVAIAFGRSGNMQIELMQPLRGEGIHFEFLATRGPGAHHLGFYVEDLDAMAEATAADGFPPVMSSGIGSSRFCYLDTIDAIGLYLELIEDPDDTIMKMMPWWDDPPTTA